MRKDVAAVIVLIVSVLLYFLFQNHDTDLVNRFYQKFGPEPCSVLRGKVVWITGASSGIGEHLAYDLAACGCKLVLSARTKSKLEKVKNKCADIGVKQGFSFNKDESILVLPLDVTSFSSHVNLSEQVIQKFGQIDILVNNAGVSQMVKYAINMPFQVEQNLLDINLLGAMSLTKAVLPHMMKRNQGQIVAVNSVFAKFVLPGFAAYCASKFGLKGYFDALRVEMAFASSNIKVVNVLPGPVVSNILDNALSSTYNVTAKDDPNFQQHKNQFDRVPFMATERFTYLMMVAMVNNLEESWMAPAEILSTLYLSHYLHVL